MQGLVSILIPAYNAGTTIKACLDSCLGQTYANIEVLLLDNGSTDQTAAIAAACNDPRLHIISQPHNLGIAPARNVLLKAAKGEYIAWIDADDTMQTARIALQTAYLDQHPETDIVGSWIQTDNADLPVQKMPLHHHEISALLWFRNCMAQPALMSRNFYSAENIFYDESYQNALEDYELWYRLRKRKQFANLPLCLTVYHMSTGNALIEKLQNNGFEENLQRLWRVKWVDLNLPFSDSEKRSFQSFLQNNEALSEQAISDIRKILYALRRATPSGMIKHILPLHYLRLWRNMNVMQRIRHIRLIWQIRHYPELKRRFLIG